MTESIGIRVTEIASRYVDIYLSEAATEEYPYAVYTSEVAPVYSKDGIHHYQADVVITVYDKDLEVVNPIAEHIRRDIADTMSGGAYSSRLLRDRSDCIEDVWFRELTYSINQYH